MRRYAYERNLALLEDQLNFRRSCLETVVCFRFPRSPGEVIMGSSAMPPAEGRPAGAGITEVCAVVVPLKH